MSTWIKLFIFCCFALQFTPGKAEMQPSNNDKVYVSFNQLHFAENGIAIRDSEGQLIPISNLGCDNNGYYLTGVWDSIFMRRVIVQCTHCGATYFNRAPQPCEACDKSAGFNYIEDEDYWDRDV